jgi:hypothetical protein
MKIRLYILLLTSFCLVLVTAPRVHADSEQSQEYKVKSAFLYNFIKFVDWPKEKGIDVNVPIIIGIIGSKDFVKAFEPIKDKKVKDRNVSIKYFADYEKLKKSSYTDDSQWDKKMQALKVCHVLMFCSRDSVSIQNSKQIVKALEGLPILTVGEAEHFLESGGVINFLMEDKKVSFEVNAAAAKKNKLKISSKLLRLAKRVIEEK